MHGPDAGRWQRRLGVSHSVWDEPVTFGPGATEASYDDPTFDRIVYRPFGTPARRRWRVVRHPDLFPEARVARSVTIAPDQRGLMARLMNADSPDEVAFLAGEAPPDGPGPRARAARLARWDGDEGVVEHDGTCDLVLLRAFDAGWRARVNGEPWRPVVPADGGLVTVRLTGAGPSRVTLRYEPPGLLPGAIVSAAAVAAALGVLGTAAASRRRGGAA
jgi:hypothetical protein